MKVELLPSTVGQPSARQFCSGAIINDVIAVDAGTLGLLWPIERQMQIRHVVLSHSHLDHIATLPMFLDNVYQAGPACPAVYAGEETLQALRDHVFNDQLWPDFIQLSDAAAPFLQLHTLRTQQALQLDGITITPIGLNHVIPTFGFLFQNRDCAVAFVSDTGPTDRVWELLAQTDRLQAVFLEASFPDSHRWLAERSGHLCSQMFDSEIRKAANNVRVIACHLKPVHFDTIAAELQALDRPGLEIGVPGRVYEF